MGASVARREQFTESIVQLWVAAVFVFDAEVPVLRVRFTRDKVFVKAAINFWFGAAYARSYCLNTEWLGTRKNFFFQWEAVGVLARDALVNHGHALVAALAIIVGHTRFTRSLGVNEIGRTRIRQWVARPALALVLLEFRALHTAAVEADRRSELQRAIGIVSACGAQSRLTHRVLRAAVPVV